MMEVHRKQMLILSMIESWLKLLIPLLHQTNILLMNNINYQKNINKEKHFINDELYVLPYYISVFGHFAGDLLGSLLFFK